MIRVVLDANIVISALIRPHSPPGRILKAAIDHSQLRMLTSAVLLDELQRALAYEHLQRYLRMTTREQEEFVVMLEQFCETVSIDESEILGIRRDPKDEPYLLVAREGRAHFIVSGDKYLLVLQYFSDIPIVNAVDFERVMSVYSGD
jgi:putative PIN family toxin of toxin-antitoxin system